MNESNFGKSLVIKEPKWNKCKDVINHHRGKIAGIPGLVALIFVVLPYAGINPPVENVLEETIEPNIFIDTRNPDGWYHGKVINLNHPDMFSNTFRVEGFVPNAGKITVTFENFTIGGPYDPKYFKPIEETSKFKDWFDVSNNSFSEEVTLDIWPRFRVTDEEYIFATDYTSTCTTSILKAFYKIEYYDALKKTTSTFYLQESFSGEWKEIKPTCGF